MAGLKRRVYEILVEPPEGDRLANGVSLGILALIAANVIVSVAETEPELAAAWPRFFYWFEVFSVAVFTVEYVGRLWSCTADDRYAGAIAGRFRIAREPMSIIDLLAIAPFYVQALVPGLDLRFVRALRLFRLFRVFKVGRYAESFVMIAKVFKDKREELAISVVIVLIAVILASSVMWLCENEAQPEAFRSVPSGMWWAIITITTIGYGDVSPVTGAGKVVGGIIAFLGVCIFALPVGILGSAFLDEVQRLRAEKERRRAERAAERREADRLEAQESEGGAPPAPGSLTCPHCGGSLSMTVAAGDREER